LLGTASICTPNSAGANTYSRNLAVISASQQIITKSPSLGKGTATAAVPSQLLVGSTSLQEKAAITNSPRPVFQVP